MTDKLQDHEEIRHSKHVQQNLSGAHLCPDWDFMAIHDGMPEADACTCNLGYLNIAPKERGDE